MKNVMIAVALALVLACGFAAYRYWITRPVTLSEPENEKIPVEPSPSMAETGSERDIPKEAPPLSPIKPETQEEVLPDLEISDTWLREQISDKEGFLDQALQSKHIIRKLVTATDLAWRDENPGRQWSALQPKGETQVEKRDDGKIYLSAKNYERYNLAVLAFELLNTETLANLYKRTRPLFLEAHGELGANDNEWDIKMAVILDQLIQIEVPFENLELKGREGIYIFADEKLEDLAPLQKAFIRMGPDHAMKIQRKLRELKTHLYQ